MAKLKYIQGEARTNEQHNANSSIMELACDLADVLLVKKMRVKSIDSKKVTIYDKENDCYGYTEEAQDIFNELYDQKMDELYKVANTIKGKVTCASLRKQLKKLKK